MKNKYKIVITATVVFAITFLIVGNNAHLYRDSHINETVVSIAQAYEYVDSYAKKYLGKKYELYSVSANYDINFYGNIEFVYTKRTDYFRDVYFIDVNTQSGEIKRVRQSEAKRLYGRDIITYPYKWNINEDMIFRMATDKNVEFDSVSWNTIYGDKISIKYIMNEEVIYRVEADLYTGGILACY